MFKFEGPGYYTTTCGKRLLLSDNPPHDSYSYVGFLLNPEVNCGHQTSSPFFFYQDGTTVQVGNPYTLKEKWVKPIVINASVFAIVNKYTENIIYVDLFFYKVEKRFKHLCLETTYSDFEILELNIRN